MKTATVAIIMRGSQILLGRKQGDPEIGEGTLNGPGGKIEPIDKTILDCLLRETEEELGIVLDPKKVEKVAIIIFYAADEPYMKVHFYRTSSFKNEPRETKSMVPEWHDIGKIPFERMLESDPHWFPQLIRGDRFCTNVYYREKAKGFLKIDPFLPFIDSD